MESSKCMTMGPWIHREQILSLDQTDLDGGFPLAKEEIPRISDVARPQVGLGDALVGPSGACLGPLACCHVHLVQMFMFVTILAYFCYISCTQIILQAQVELGEI
jgi:hypothetical protein